MEKLEFWHLVCCYCIGWTGFINHQFYHLSDMVQINHWISKRVEKGSQRLFFQLVNDSSLPMKGNVLLELRWLLGAVYNIDVPLDKTIEVGQRGFFYFDLPEASGKKWKSFEWVWHDGDKKFQGKGKKTDKYEELV
jgi:hypothetical protein